MVELISQRLTELTADGDAMEDLVCFVIVDSDTRLSDIESALNRPVLSADGRPMWEVLQARPDGFEWVFVLHDSGYGAIVLVPDCPETDAQVLELCRLHSVGAVAMGADTHAMASVEGEQS